MIIWKGYGILVLVITFVIGWPTSYIFGKLGYKEDTGAAIGAIIAGVAIWFVGKKLNAPDNNKVILDKLTGQQIPYKQTHSMFYIPMQYWAFIISGIGLIGLITMLK
jgi:hypothetical protein